MSQIMHTLRFVVGMAMLAGGAALAQPFVSAVLAARQSAGAGATPSPDDRQVAVPALAIGAAGHAIPDPRQPLPSAGMGEGVAFADQVGQPPHGLGHREQQVPPAAAPVAPPDPLPASGLEFSPGVPPLEGTYRSTVDIPPPPLLDGHAPPPLAVGWSVRDVGGQVASGPVVQPAAVPAEYSVRDGDDLTGIALRVYGHAGAAAAIWAANRDRLTDPHLLPIGLPLRLPPSWTLPAQPSRGAAGGLAIEPAFGGSSDNAAASGPRPAAPPRRDAAERSWLDAAAAGR